MQEPFHIGERTIQERTGERDVALSRVRNMSDRIPHAGRRLMTQQHFVLLGWAAPEGDLWATFIAGPQGFAAAEADGTRLRLALTDDAGTLRRIPPLERLRAGEHVGVLFLEPGTRRRLRVNGRALHVGAQELILAADVAYALCPKYIQRRRLQVRPHHDEAPEIREGEKLDADLIRWIEGTDTFFVASAHPDGPTDVSHRGGRSGFTRVQDGVLRIPDYPGNSMFNTLGNFALRPRAGLVFVDFDGNRQLQLTGSVRLDLNGNDVRGLTGGTGRWWDFCPERWRVSPLNQAFEWELLEESPFNP